MRMKGMAAVLNDAARNRLCESSGSEHFSPDHSDDLSELVNSFIEGDFTTCTVPPEDSKLEDDPANDNENNYNMLQDLLHANNDDDEKVREKIRAQAQLACEIIGKDSSQPSFKRRLMSHLRRNGFDAGLCKSRWGKFGKHLAGEYEYIDVNVDGKQRFIVEVNLATEFEIARPTAAYTALLNIFPQVFIGKPEEVKKIVRLMCSAVRLSMKQMKLHVPPWRRNGYMRAKWFGPYNRTINPLPAAKNKPDEALAAKRSVGFEANFPAVVKPYNCRADDYFFTKAGLKVGYLTAALDHN